MLNVKTIETKSKTSQAQATNLLVKIIQLIYFCKDDKLVNYLLKKML